MNFIFISPQFPRTYWNWCDRLKKNGANVLGIGDTPYDDLAPELKQCLTEYYKVETLEDYDQVFRAVAFFSFKYGKIHWLESNNEYWLEHDSMLRTDFNILSGPDVDEIQAYRSKAAMKPYYKKAGVPTCRQAPVTTQEEAEKFIKKVGYPVIVKPEYGVGAAATWRLENEEDLAAFFAEKPEDAYVMEEYVYGWICSYDAIVDSQSNVLFESMSISPPIMDIVNEQTELVFGIMATIAEEESRSISSNLNWSRRARLKKGKPYGQVTYGYRERKDHTWYVYEPEAERVRTAFRMAIECRNYTEIRDALQLMEEHDETGKKWIQSNLQYLLTNPYYTGVYISNKTVDTLIEGRGKVRVENKGERGQFIIENHHDALISKENFEMVEKLVETKALYTPKNWRKQHGEYSDKENAESA